KRRWKLFVDDRFGKWSKDRPEDAREHSLAKDLNSGCVVPRNEFATVDALHLGLAEESWAELGLHEGAAVYFVIGLRDYGNLFLGAVDDGEGEAVASGLMAGVVAAKSVDGLRDPLRIGAVNFGIRWI